MATTLNVLSLSSSGNMNVDALLGCNRNLDYRSGSPTGSESSGVSSVDSTIADLMVIIRGK